jgi:hypothetical protein
MQAVQQQECQAQPQGRRPGRQGQGQDGLGVADRVQGQAADAVGQQDFPGDEIHDRAVDVLAVHLGRERLVQRMDVVDLDGVGIVFVAFDVLADLDVAGCP